MAGPCPWGKGKVDLSTISLSAKEKNWLADKMIKENI